MIYKCGQEAGHELSGEERERLLPFLDEHIEAAKQRANKERGERAAQTGGVTSY